MPSRMDKYYSSNVKKRTDKNKELYRTMYDDVSYNNVEEISIIEKNEKIDIDKIRELINGTNNINKPKPIIEKQTQIQEEQEEQKNYDIRDVLNKAKSERTDRDSRFSKTKYNILTDDNINQEIKSNEERLKGIMDAISNPIDDTLDLLDDLKSICDPNLKSKVTEKMKDEVNEDIDKSFYTSSVEFSNEDFDDYEEEPKKNTWVTKLLLFILLFIIIAGIMFLIYHFKS